MSSSPSAPQPSLVRASGSMAVASLVSRLTGFVRQLALAAALGLSVLNDSYTVANTLPNIVYELLLGGVLSSVMVPLLVRAQSEDRDGGEAYTQKLLTVSAVVLVLATVLAIVTAPLLTWLYLGGESHSAANPQLATAFAVLLLPEIVFYGLGALFGAILNTRGVFAPFAWAPVLNNVVMLGVLGIYLLMPGEINLNPISLNDPKVLVLGLGTTLGIAVQALVLVPWMRKAGFRWRPRWGWDRRLLEAGGLYVWVIGYVLIGQAGYIVTTRVAAPFAGSVSTYANAWLLLQVPYGVLGVSLLTALLPRMSRSAASGRLDEVVKDLSLGSRYSTLTLLPVTVLITLFGTSIGVALFSLGRTSEAGASRLGATLAVSAFGLLPYALSMLQLRVFYAMKDARTPTVIQLVMVLVKIPMLLACPALLPPGDVVLGLAVANSASFVIGAVLGQLWLRHRLGPLDSSALAVTFGKTAVASTFGGLAGAGLVLWIRDPLAGQVGTVAQAWIVLGAGAVTALVVTVAAMRVVRLTELDPVWRRLARR
ncbi:MAG TPA: murein biosynthesis integral membrane protein MurJ [Pseudonocardia sp.]|uniref:murein biosynthesis integral membrane protein MurJ n=1 Tax=Pseudonocardia sp. TaxID=60912 RepID=UPI002C2139DE|nr:murein biosynthesis integral membrane protein MurJ [Pseudonocardia sp.]HTF55614.1 murein biosynthesis integral membrane protein MurJ [Pseudonocardia sp.]